MQPSSFARCPLPRHCTEFQAARKPRKRVLINHLQFPPGARAICEGSSLAADTARPRQKRNPPTSTESMASFFASCASPPTVLRYLPRTCFLVAERNPRSGGFRSKQKFGKFSSFLVEIRKQTFEKFPSFLDFPSLWKVRGYVCLRVGIFARGILDRVSKNLRNSYLS